MPTGPFSIPSKEGTTYINKPRRLVRPLNVQGLGCGLLTVPAQDEENLRPYVYEACSSKTA